MEIVTPTGKAFSGVATAVVAPGTEGYLGVLAGHAPFITSLKPGKLSFETGGERREMAIGAGHIEVTPNSVIVFTETAKGTETP